MSLAATLGTIGLAMKDIDETKRANAIQDERLAADREDRIQRRRMNDLSFSQLADRAAQEKTARERAKAYNDLTLDAKGDEDFLTKKIAKAKELGDGETMLATRDQLAKYKTGQLKTAVDGGLRRLLGTGDPTGLQDAYNNLFPDGNKVAVTRKPDGKYDLSFVDPSGKIVAEQPDMTVDGIGMMAMKLMDSKFAEDVWKQQLKDDQALRLEDKKGENKLKRDVTLEGVKSRLGIAADERRADRESQNIAQRGLEERKTGAANAAAQGAQTRLSETWRAVTKDAMDGGAGDTKATKEEDRRVKQGRAALDKYFGISQFTGLDQNSQPAYLDALDAMNREIRAGGDPEEAAVKAARTVAAKTKAKKLTGGAPTAALPSFQ